MVGYVDPHGMVGYVDWHGMAGYVDLHDMVRDSAEPHCMVGYVDPHGMTVGYECLNNCHYRAITCLLQCAT